MILTYKDGKLTVGEKKPFDSPEVFKELKKFGVKDYKCKKTDSLEIITDKDLTQAQQDQLKTLLDTMDMKKSKQSDLNVQL